MGIAMGMGIDICMGSCICIGMGIGMPICSGICICIAMGIGMDGSMPCHGSGQPHPPIQPAVGAEEASDADGATVPEVEQEADDEGEEEDEGEGEAADLRFCCVFFSEDDG